MITEKKKADKTYRNIRLADVDPNTSIVGTIKGEGYEYVGKKFKSEETQENTIIQFSDIRLADVNGKLTETMYGEASLFSNGKLRDQLKQFRDGDRVSILKTLKKGNGGIYFPEYTVVKVDITPDLNSTAGKLPIGLDQFKALCKINGKTLADTLNISGVEYKISDYLTEL